MSSGPRRPVLTIAGPEPKMSLLRRLADKIEPTPEQLATIRKPKSIARRIKPMHEIDEAADVYRPGEPPQPTNGAVQLLNGETRLFFSDGSLRNPVQKLTKAERKRRKKMRNHQMNFGRPKEVK